MSTDDYRDDRAWPRGALPLSWAVGLTLLITGVVVVLRVDRPAIAAAFFAASLSIGPSLMVPGTRRWLADGEFPRGLGCLAGVFAAGGLALGEVVGGFPIAGVFGVGLIAGCMLTNVWAVRKARNNRPESGHNRH